MMRGFFADHRYDVGKAEEDELRGLQVDAHDKLCETIGVKALAAIERAKQSAIDLEKAGEIPRKTVAAVTASAIGTILGKKALEKN
ncbi:MAG: hypothetical protein ACOYNL_02645 [Rickettsiales bacterium]